MRVRSHRFLRRLNFKVSPVPVHHLVLRLTTIILWIAGSSNTTPPSTLIPIIIPYYLPYIRDVICRAYHFVAFMRGRHNYWIIRSILRLGLLYVLCMVNASIYQAFEWFAPCDSED